MVHILDEKSIPAPKIEILWAMEDSIPQAVLTWFPAPMAASKIGSQQPVPEFLSNLWGVGNRVEVGF